MRKHVALTVVGRDMPGIVASVTEVLFESGCNIEDSSMTILGGEFAMILIVSLPAGLAGEELSAGLGPVRERMELAISVKDLREEDLGRGKRPEGNPYILTVLGSDKPGIVYRVSSILASRGINITDVRTRVIGEEKSPIYTMVLEVDCPGSTGMKEVERELEGAGRDLNVDIRFRPLETARL